MRRLSELSPQIAKQIRVVFTDIDDTLTTEGRLPWSSYRAMWELSEAGVAVVPVTGRPAGWCDHLARMWPVAGVVGENGAFYFRYDPSSRKLRARFLLSARERSDLQRKLARIGRLILKRVPGTAIASDQPYRIHDLAIDYAEDVGPLPKKAVDAIVSIFEESGATAKVSSIHVNGWFGDYDKLGMIKRFAREVLGLDLERAHRSRALYVGDSPNDEPAFEFFERSVGVANIHRFADRLLHPPTYVTRASGGDGFAEIARHLLRAKLGRRSSRARV
jgi:HAD superfamily hydrolase (TIGR01484 family)